MFVILAGARDSAAQALASRAHMSVLTPRDLSLGGWYCRFGSQEPGNAVLGGEIFPTQSICGVVTRLPWISPADLGHVAEDDRHYVAAEMHAFLFAWLSKLRCPLLNRPTPHCLSGPAWRNEHWIHTAARLEIPVRPARRSAVPGVRFQPALPTGPIRTVTVVGGKCAGDRSTALERYTLALAAASGCAMLSANYQETVDGLQLLDVNLWPDLANVELQDLVLNHFSDQRPTG